MKWTSPDTCRLWQLPEHPSASSSISSGWDRGEPKHPPSSRGRLSRQQPHRAGAVQRKPQHPQWSQTVPEPLPPSSSTAVWEKGAKGLSSARRALCVCLPAFQYSSQSLRFLLWCCASERSGPAAHFPVTDTRTAQGHRDRSGLAGNRSPSTGNTHQLHLRTQPFQDPVGSLRLLLQGGKGTGRKKLLVPSVTSRGSLLKPLLKPPRGQHKSHPCPREKAQLSLRTGTRGTMALKHPSRAQE